jgi:hypothetical protein
MTTYGHLNQAIATLSQEDFLARTLAAQAGKPESAASEAGCFSNSCESFARWDHDSSCWRTYQRCFIEEWKPYLQSWPKAGSMRNGRAYPQRQSVLRTEEKEYSLWPTPQASDSIRCGMKPETLRKQMLRNKADGHGGATFGVALAEEFDCAQSVGITEWAMGFPPEWTAVDSGG